jgi:hypothetical protein
MHGAVHIVLHSMNHARGCLHSGRSLLKWLFGQAAPGPCLCLHDVQLMEAGGVEQLRTQQAAHAAAAAYQQQQRPSQDPREALADQLAMEVRCGLTCGWEETGCTGALRRLLRPCV